MDYFLMFLMGLIMEVIWYSVAAIGLTAVVISIICLIVGGKPLFRRFWTHIFYSWKNALEEKNEGGSANHI